MLPGERATLNSNRIPDGTLTDLGTFYPSVIFSAEEMEKYGDPFS
jgi:hypothetical protein